MTKCKFCGKPTTTDPVFGRRGQRPISRLNMKKAKSMRPDLFARACYDYTIVDGVVCVDVHDGWRAEHKDIAEIVAELSADDIDVTTRPAIYSDAWGTWTMLIVHNGQYSGERFSRERNREVAIKKAKALFARPDIRAASQLP